MYNKFDLREAHEECGVVGFYGVKHASAHAFIALQALQHRGQQGCGIASRDEEGKLCLHKGVGLVKEVFNQAVLETLPGDACIGHVRYPTTEVGGLENLQPFRVNSRYGAFSLAHNGNIVNSQVIKASLEAHGQLFHSTSDSELFAHLIGLEMPGLSWEKRIASAANQLDGAFCAVILTADCLYACRDKYGFRPLSLARLEGGYVVASETCAFDSIGARFIRDIEPGELLRIDRDGLHSLRHSRCAGGRMCAMEYIYFARPDSQLDGCPVQAFRKLSGKLLYREHPVQADMVINVPDSSIDAAIGYAEASGIPLEMGLIKNKYVARTFIQPSQSMRSLGVRMKLAAVKSVVNGKRLAVVDDSIVRGTTSRQIVQMLRQAGAREVHLCIASPVYAHPCFYGIDTGSPEQLIGARHSVQEICDFIGADSLHYLSEKALYEASGRSSLCTACFSGNYPTDLYTDEEDYEEK